MAHTRLERRQFPRINHTYTISFKRYKDTEYAWDISNARNLSLGGALFLSSEFFPPDSLLDIKLNIPGQSKHCQCQAKVQRCERSADMPYYKTAINFNNMDDSYTETLKKSIDFFLAKG